VTVRWDAVELADNSTPDASEEEEDLENKARDAETVAQEDWLAEAATQKPSWGAICWYRTASAWCWSTIEGGSQCRDHSKPQLQLAGYLSVSLCELGSHGVETGHYTVSHGQNERDVHGSVGVGIRVADASITPDCVSANLNATTIMIGDRISSFIRTGQ